MSAPAVRLALVHPALNLLDTITDGMSVELVDGAVCGADPELHTGLGAFADEPTDEREAREQVAKEVCVTDCPVRGLCLARALSVRPGSGVWAGLTADEIGDLAHVLDTFGVTGRRSEVA